MGDIFDQVSGSGDIFDKVAPSVAPPAIPKVPASIQAALDRGQSRNESSFGAYDDARMAGNDQLQNIAGTVAGFVKRPFQIVGGMAKKAYDANVNLAQGNGSVGDVLNANPATSIPSQVAGGTFDATAGALAGTEGGKKAIAGSYLGQGLDNIGDPYKVGENTGGGLFDAASMAVGDKIPQILSDVLKGRGAPPTVAAASEIHGAALRNAGGAPAKADIGATTSTAAPAMLEAADQLGVHGKNVTPAKWAQVSERAIQNQGDAFNSLIKQADPQTPVAAETKAAADSLRQEALAERNPNVAAKMNEVADRIEKETTLGGADQLRRSLNKETIAHHRKVNVSDANADLVNEANLNAVGKMRDIVYDKTGQQLGIDPDAIQQMKRREGALIRQNDWVQNSRKLIENDRLVEKNTGPINQARYQNQLPNASKSGVVSTVGKSILGGRDAAFRSQLGKFLDAPRVPVQYPTANPRVANQSRLAGIVRRAGLNQPQTGVPAGAASTPLDEFLRHNNPQWRPPDMGQATSEIMGQPLFQPEGGSVRVNPLPRQGDVMLQDINPPHWPQRVQPQAAPTMSPIPAAGAEVPRVAPGQATYYKEPQYPVEWLDSQSQPAHPVLREIANKAKNGASNGSTGRMEDITPANWPYQQASQPKPRAWYESDQWTRPSGRSTDVSAADLADWIRRNGKRR